MAETYGRALSSIQSPDTTEEKRFVAPLLQRLADSKHNSSAQPPLGHELCFGGIFVHPIFDIVGQIVLIPHGVYPYL